MDNLGKSPIDLDILRGIQLTEGWLCQIFGLPPDYFDQSVKDINMATHPYVESSDGALLASIVIAWKLLRDQKPNDHSDRDRRFAVTMTELEKAIAYFKTYVVDGFEVGK